MNNPLEFALIADAEAEIYWLAMLRRCQAIQAAGAVPVFLFRDWSFN